MLTNTSLFHSWIVPTLYKPNNFKDNKIAYAQIRSFKREVTVEDVFNSDMIWVGGGFFLGTIQLMHEWTISYMAAVEDFIDHGMMSTDQQVLYALAIKDEKHRVMIQHYSRTMQYPLWFHLGYMCMDEGSRKFKSSRWYRKKTKAKAV